MSCPSKSKKSEPDTTRVSRFVIDISTVHSVRIVMKSQYTTKERWTVPFSWPTAHGE
jgi:hypothetical protein